MEVSTAAASITMLPVRSTPPLSKAVAPNSTYGDPTSISCGLSSAKAITGEAEVSTTFTVRGTVTAGFPDQSVTS